MAEQAPTIVRTPDELDCEWLSRVAGAPVASFECEQIGTGQMSESHRLALAYEGPGEGGPATLVVKLASGDAHSRGAGVGLGIYAREVRFYQELAPRLQGPLARCLFACSDEAEGYFTLVLEDLAPATAGDQIAGCSVEQAALALRELARLQGPVWDDPALGQTDWLNPPSPINQAFASQLLPGFLERYGERIEPAHRALCERFVASLDRWLEQREGPRGLVHGDFRLDNLLFADPASARPLGVVDWQTVGWGAAMADAAYFLGGGLLRDDRRASEARLLEGYLGALQANGVAAIDERRCSEQFRHSAFGGVLMALVASMLVQRTDRGDEMFMAMLGRHAQHALDVGAEELLARAPASRPAPGHPAAHDERRHDPEPAQLWNESWYFDAVAPDGGLGAYVRIGLYPNMGVCWYTALVCGPRRPTVAVIDFAAPLATGEELALQTAALRAEHRCEQPLERFAVALEATGQAHADPAALLRGEPGRASDVALELVWETDGQPYAYRLTTRYEIPCRVSGTIRLGEAVISLSDAIGQRDHSWGTRDWWSMDWMWSAGALDDGTRLHAVQLRLPGGPQLGLGYLQTRDGALQELDHVEARETLAGDGLIAGAVLSLGDPALALDIEPLAFGPLRLVAPDGRVSHFPRAMCRMAAADGRTGLGWVEWNLNQRR